MNTSEYIQYSLPFIKMQGVGNDFVLIDNRAGVDRNWPSLAVKMCDRRFGVGADGLLVVYATENADAGMRMFNPDGSEDFCGNGLRCAARFAAAEQPRSLTIETLAGIREANVEYSDSGECSITVDMGLPSFRPSDVPIQMEATEAIDYPLTIDGKTWTATSLSTGTTHTIIFVHELPDDEEFLRFSPRIETNPLFPERTSIMWTKVESANRISLRIWERGAGETWGCGSGASAAAVAAIRKELVQSPVTVVSRGGCLIVAWEEDSRIEMTGPAEFVFRGTFKKSIL